MKTKIAALLSTLALLVALAGPASAGNGTNDFYLSGSCNPSNRFFGAGVTFRWTNWDSGANQVYHLSATRSGVAFNNAKAYIDGVWKWTASNATFDIMVTVSGHGAHVLKFTNEQVMVTGNVTCTRTV